MVSESKGPWFNLPSLRRLKIGFSPSLAEFTPISTSLSASMKMFPSVPVVLPGKYNQRALTISSSFSVLLGRVMPGSSREASLALGVGDRRRGRQTEVPCRDEEGPGGLVLPGAVPARRVLLRAEAREEVLPRGAWGRRPAAFTASPLSDGSGTRDQKLRKSPKQINVYCPPDHVVKHSIFLHGNF